MLEAAIYFAAFLCIQFLKMWTLIKKYGLGKSEPYHHLTETLKQFI